MDSYDSVIISRHPLGNKQHGLYACKADGRSFADTNQLSRYDNLAQQHAQAPQTTAQRRKMTTAAERELYLLQQYFSSTIIPLHTEPVYSLEKLI